MRRVLPIVAVVVVLLLATATTALAKPQGWTTICSHVVQPGETIYCIARAYGVSATAIATYNGITNPNRIRPGQVLAIPDAYATLPAGPVCARQCGVTPPACTCATYHTVVAGNNLYRISLTYGVSMWRIAECNGILNLNLLRVGQVLCIPAP
jgi:LysM repeat protein